VCSSEGVATGPPPEVNVPWPNQPGEIGFCDFTKVKRVENHSAGEPLSAPAVPLPPGLERLGLRQVVHGGEALWLLFRRVAERPGRLRCVPRELRNGSAFGCQFRKS